MTSLTTIKLNTVAIPPEWALWQRKLLDELYPAAIEFVERYTRDDGTLIWRDEWPGMDGSDDGYESFYNFPLYYALGGAREIHSLSRKLWDAITCQFTGYGQIYKEFDGYYDWMHHGESSTYLYFLGLADPSIEKDRQRALRFAGLYLNEDPEAHNYDPQRKLLRSPINGSRGPRFVTTADDWVTHRPVLANYPLPYDDIHNVESSDAWNDDEKFPFILRAMNDRMMRGDIPLNLTCTSLVLNAYMYTGDEKYQQWIEEYVDAWIERLNRNNGILPDNIGPNNKIGECMDGRWWGGYYGWQWPHGLLNIFESTMIGASNAYLVSGNAKYLELPRSVLRLAASQSQINSAGHVVVPHRYGDQGWHDFRPIEPQWPIDLWNISQADEDRQLIDDLVQDPSRQRTEYKKEKGDSSNSALWLKFIEENDSEYPVQILEATYAETLHRLNIIRNDHSTPSEQDVHHWQDRNPVVLEGLVHLMLGSPNHIYHGGLLNCRVFYFDPAHNRPGVPRDVAALVDRITPDSISVTLVNLHSREARDVILQAGAFGEHEFAQVRSDSETVTVNGKNLQVRICAGAMGRLEIGMKRFVHQPSYAFPWHGE